jgi:hypothetical protein
MTRWPPVFMRWALAPSSIRYLQLPFEVLPEDVLASSVDGALVLCFSRSGVAVNHARQDLGSCDDIGSIEIAGRVSHPARLKQFVRQYLMDRSLQTIGVPA